MGKDADCCDTCRMFGDESKAPEPPPPAPPAHADRIKLVIESRGETREVLPHGPHMKVGRGKQCDIAIPDANLSRVQCVLFFDERGIFVKDSGSTCGTFVDGRKISGPAQLQVGTKIFFGDSVVRVVAR